MPKPRLTMLAALLTAHAAYHAAAQTFPAKPVRAD